MSPKITAHGGATNAHGADVSPADAVSTEPQVVAEDDLGPSTSAEVEEPVEETGTEVQEDTEPDYDGMTLAEMRKAAGDRNLPTYGSKANIIERLRAADAEDTSE